MPKPYHPAPSALSTPRRNLRIIGYGRKAVDLDAFVTKQCANIKASQKPMHPWPLPP